MNADIIVFTVQIRRQVALQAYVNRVAAVAAAISQVLRWTMVPLGLK